MFQTHDIVLVLVAASLVLNIAVVLQRRGRIALGFVGLLAINLGLTAVALQQSAQGLLFVLAVGGFAALVVAPAILGYGMRLALRRGAYARAIQLLELRQLLQPGLGLERERQMLAGLALVTQGRGEEAVRVAQHQLANETMDGPLRRAILERLLTLLVVERRFDEAFELFDREGGLVLVSQSAGVGVTMVRAFGERGEIEAATRCLAVLEQSPAALDPGLGPMVNSARLGYLAHLGRVDELEPLLAEGSTVLPGITAQRRKLWRGIALGRAGRQEEARALWQQVVAEEELDPQAAELARWRLGESEPIVVEEPLPEAAAALVELVQTRATAYRPVPRPRGSFLRTAPATALLLALVVGIHGALAFWGGGKPEPLEPWLLLRWGANFPLVSLSTEPWRLIASMFLHVNLLHLITNLVGLYMLGRFTEQLFGSWRFWTIYFVAGVVGAATSAKIGGGLLSVGASGAIFGLLGAALVGLHALRGQVPDSWRRQLSINLLIVIGLQVAIGMRFEMIDNAAHFGGLGGGFLVALALRPRSGSQRERAALWPSGVGGVVGAVLGLALLSAAGAAAYSTARSSLPQLLAHIPRQEIQRVGFVVRCPKQWYVADQRRGLSLHDPLLALAPAMVILPPEALPRASGKHVERSLDRVAREGNRQYAEQLRQSKGLRDLRVMTQNPQRIGPDLVRSELRVLVGERVRYELLYFKLRGSVLLTIVARVTRAQLALYRPVFDEVALSVGLTDRPDTAPAAQGKSSSPGR